MRRLATFVALLLLLTTAAPMLACMTGATMTREQSACCRAMHGECGEMTSEMVQMDCCRTAVRSSDLPQIATIPPALSLPWTVLTQPVPFALARDTKRPALRRVPADYLPPGTLGARTAILRI